MSSTQKIDIKGRWFGSLYAMREVGTNKFGCQWYCICTCGNRVVAVAAQLLAGRYTSCGCARGMALAEHTRRKREWLDSGFRQSESRDDRVRRLSIDTALDNAVSVGVTVSEKW